MLGLGYLYFYFYSALLSCSLLLNITSPDYNYNSNSNSTSLSLPLYTCISILSIPPNPEILTHLKIHLQDFKSTHLTHLSHPISAIRSDPIYLV